MEGNDGDGTATKYGHIGGVDLEIFFMGLKPSYVKIFSMYSMYKGFGRGAATHKRKILF
jgi:hypothetical protein